MEARRTAKLAVIGAKEQSWKEFGENLESGYRSANKRFWQTIRRLRERKAGVVGGVKSKDDTLFLDEPSVLYRWKEYFCELLNPVEATKGDRNEVSGGTENSPTAAEVVAAIRSLKNGKAAGVGEIRPEMLKSFGEEEVSRVIKVAWERGSVPLDWQTGVIVPIFKKGSRRDRSNYRETTLLSIPGKVNTEGILKSFFMMKFGTNHWAFTMILITLF